MRTRTFCHDGYHLLEFYQALGSRTIKVESSESIHNLEVKYWVEDSTSNLFNINSGFSARIFGCPYFYSNAEVCELNVSPFMRMCVEVGLNDAGMISMPSWIVGSKAVPFRIVIENHNSFLSIIYRVFSLAIGFALVIHAKEMARSVTFHYVSGTTLGVGFLGLVLLLFVLRIFGIGRGKTAAVGIAAAYTSLLGVLWQQARHVLVSYWYVLAGYIVISAMLSFAVAHYYLKGGMPLGSEIRDILRWSISLVGFIICCWSTTDSFIFSCIFFVLYFGTLKENQIELKLKNLNYSFLGVATKHWSIF